MSGRSYRKGWAAVRRACLERDKRCQKCGVVEYLEAHHKLARVHGGKDELSNLIALCSDCHEEWTCAEPLKFDDWLLVPPGRFLVGMFSVQWPDDVSAADFKLQLLGALDRYMESQR